MASPKDSISDDEVDNGEDDSDDEAVKFEDHRHDMTSAGWKKKSVSLVSYSQQGNLKIKDGRSAQVYDQWRERDFLLPYFTCLPC